MSAQQILYPESSFRVVPGLCALGIMTKAPEAGKVKTRLTPPLTGDEASQLNICFLRDIAGSIAEACAQLPARGVGIYTPFGVERVYEDILPRDFCLILQRGDKFSERLIFAVQDLF